MSLPAASGFETIDSWIASQNIICHSLNPTQPCAPTFQTLWERWQSAYPHAEESFFEVYAGVILDFVQKQVRFFPENIFWDYAYLFQFVIEEALSAAQPLNVIAEYHKLLTDLLKIFGNEGNISFRYMHDFMYGFDWAKWVKKEPVCRKNTPPFHKDFLAYLLKRGKELEVLISQNDAKYHQIPEGSYRNPFVFSRNPKEEAHLLRTLAADGLLPVCAWEYGLPLQWQLPFAQLRQERALALGIPTK